MIDHIGIAVSDFAKSKAFYTQALGPTGHARVVGATLDDGREPCAGFCNEDGSDVWIRQGKPMQPFHLAFRVGSRAAVDAFHAAALAAGGKDNGAPGPRPQYHANYYAGYVLDPDGNNIEAVCHEAPGSA
jgi:catechol 2,3-dioxygenase-like lactoylglutathione lyase family enzyme